MPFVFLVTLYVLLPEFETFYPVELQISPDGTRPPHCPPLICSFYEMDQLWGWGTQAPARTL